MILSLFLAAAISVPADVYENMLFVDVRVNGSPPRSFLLDTAVPKTMLDRRIHRKSARLDIGGLELRVDDPGTIDLSFFESAEGRRLDGILGMDLFTRYAVEMDYDAGLVRFHEAATFEYGGTGAVVPLVIADGKPFLDAKLKMPGQPERVRRYLVDSGSGGALADDLFMPEGEPVGPNLGRAEYVELGPFRFEGANGITGAMKIGGELLKRFTVIADFSRSRMMLEPNRHFRDAMLFDTSGLELEQVKAGLRVVQVYPRTPAADAGLRKGDVILRIDRQPALTLGIERVRRMFHQVRTHQLTILRGGKESQVTLALRLLIPTTLAAGMPVFEVRVAGKPLTFLIDTGSPYTFLDTAAAARLGVKPERHGTIRGAGGGEVQVAIVNELTFDIGGLVSRHEVRLTDLSGLTPHFGQRLDGFFGYDLLARHVITFEPGRIVFGAYDNRGTVLPIAFGGRTNRWIYVPATIKVAGQPPVQAQFFVDSGSMDGANHPVIRNATSPLRPINTGQGLGSGGGGGVAGRAEWVQLGPHRVVDVPSICCPSLAGTEAQLGQAVLGKFIVTYDYGRKQMTVTPVTQGWN
ncbi:MAG TPA: aspartyl protease family protein [Thermoanaerobaculia bacterium]|jgi:hypothetical protein